MRRSRSVHFLRVLALFAALLVCALVPRAAYAENIRLPVTFWDYDADNVLFEYDHGTQYDSSNTPYGPGLYNGLSLSTDDFGKGSGLIESTLSADGFPVYKQSTVEKAAELMAAELVDESNTMPTDMQGEIFKLLRSKLFKKEGATYANVFPNNEDGNKTFADAGWSCDTEVEEVDSDGNTGYLNTVGYGQVWNLNTNDPYGLDSNCAIRSTFTPIEGVNSYRLIDYNHSGSMLWTIKQGSSYLKDSDGKEINGVKITEDSTAFFGNEWKGFEFQTNGTQTPVTVQIVPAEDHDDANNPAKTQDSRIYASSYSGTGRPDYSDSIWTAAHDQTCSAQWELVNTNDYRLSNGIVFRGSQLWQRLNDSGTVVSVLDNKSTLSKSFEVVGGQSYRISFRRLYGSATGLSDEEISAQCPLVAITSNGKTLAKFDDYGNTEYVNETFTIDEGITSVKVSITGRNTTLEGARLEQLQLTPIGKVKLGDYASSKKKFQDSSKGLADVETCMDYCYFVMNNFWRSNATHGGLFSATSTLGQNRRVKEIKAIELIPYEDEDHADTLPYRFDADFYKNAGTDSNKVDYNLDTGILKNDTSKGEDRYGFFPLDKISGAQMTMSTFNELKNRDDGLPDLPKTSKEHNFHFAMVGSGTFTYHKDKNQFFYFEGDDDAYLFINGKLAIDLGGAHQPAEATVNINDLASATEGIVAEADGNYYGIEEGKPVSFKFFYMERHTDLSDFIVESNIELTPDAVTLTVHKTDATSKNDAVEGATYALCDKDGNYVDVYGNAVDEADRVTATTDEEGNATFSVQSFVGNLAVREVGAAPGYMLDAQASDTVEIGDEDVQIDVTDYPAPQIVLGLTKAARATNGSTLPKTIPSIFTFKVEAVTEGAPLPTTATTVNNAGTVAFDAILPTAEGTYLYKITEAAMDSKSKDATGWKLSDEAVYAQATVKFDEDEKAFTASVSYFSDKECTKELKKPTITNTYSTSRSTAATAKKLSKTGDSTLSVVGIVAFACMALLVGMVWRRRNS